MDPDPDPELGKFEAGSGSGINSFGSNTLTISFTTPTTWKMIHPCPGFHDRVTELSPSPLGDVV